MVPIPGTRKPERVPENAEAMRYCFSADDLAAVEKVVPESEWVGDRRSFAVPVTKRGWLGGVNEPQLTACRKY